MKETITDIEQEMNDILHEINYRIIMNEGLDDLPMLTSRYDKLKDIVALG